MFVLGQYTMIIFKRTKIISLMTSWYSKNHLHRSLIFFIKLNIIKRYMKNLCQALLYLKIEKNYGNGHNHISLFKLAPFYVFFLLSEFIMTSIAHLYIFLPMKTYLFIVLQQMLIRQKHGYLTFSSIVITACYSII